MASDTEVVESITEYLRFNELNSTLECLAAESEAQRTGQQPRLGADQASDALRRRFFKAFDVGQHATLFSLWRSHIPAEVRSSESAEELEFFINLHTAVLPLRGSTSSDAARSAAMQIFKAFLDDRGSRLSQRQDLLLYYSLPFVGDPAGHPAFGALFDPMWVATLRRRFEQLLNVVLSAQQPPRLYALCGGGGSGGSGSGDFEPQTPGIVLRQRQAHLGNFATSIHRLATQLVDTLGDVRNGRVVSDDYVQTVRDQLRSFDSVLAQEAQRQQQGFARSQQQENGEWGGTPAAGEQWQQLQPQPQARAQQQWEQEPWQQQQQQHEQRQWQQPQQPQQQQRPPWQQDQLQQQWQQPQPQQPSPWQQQQQPSVPLLASAPTPGGVVARYMGGAGAHAREPIGDSPFPPLDFNKIREHLAAVMGPESTQPEMRRAALLLQALRWRLTRSDRRTRRAVLAIYVRRDIVACAHGGNPLLEDLMLRVRGHHGVRAAPGAADAGAAALARDPSRVAVVDSAARLVCAITSLAMGRRYILALSHAVDIACALLHSESAATPIRAQALLWVHNLSLHGRLAHLRMIENGMLEWIVGNLHAHARAVADEGNPEHVLSPRAVEYASALLLSLCLRRKGQFRAETMCGQRSGMSGGNSGEPAHDIVAMLSALLAVCESPGVLNCINGTLYAILTRPALKQRAVTINFDEQLVALIARCGAGGQQGEGMEGGIEGQGSGSGGKEGGEEDPLGLGEEEQRQFEFVRQQLNAILSEELQSGDDEDEDEDEEEEEESGDKENMGEMGDALVADASRGELDGEALLKRDYAPTSADQEGRSRRGSAFTGGAAAPSPEWRGGTQSEQGRSPGSLRHDGGEGSGAREQERRSVLPPPRDAQQQAPPEEWPTRSPTQRVPFSEDAPASVVHRAKQQAAEMANASIDPRLARQAPGLSLGRGQFTTTRTTLEQALPDELQSRPRIPRSRGSARGDGGPSGGGGQPQPQPHQGEYPSGDAGFGVAAPTAQYSGSGSRAAIGLRGGGVGRASPLPLYPTAGREKGAPQQRTPNPVAVARGEPTVEQLFSAQPQSPIRPHDHADLIASPDAQAGPGAVKDISQLSSVEVLHARLGEEISERWSSLRQSFLKVDKDRSGAVTQLELTRVLKEEGYVFDDGDLASLLQQFDTNGDGVIAYDEFAQMIRQAPQLR